MLFSYQMFYDLWALNLIKHSLLQKVISSIDGNIHTSLTIFDSNFRRSYLSFWMSDKPEIIPMCISRIFLWHLTASFSPKALQICVLDQYKQSRYHT